MSFDRKVNFLNCSKQIILQTMKNFCVVMIYFSISIYAGAQVSPKLQENINQLEKSIEPKMIQWRRHLHQYPELSNRETKTAAMVAEHLKSLGIEVKTGIAKTGVVGILKGSKAGPVIALRADMDALPITEKNDLPFSSKEKAIYNDQETGVMHACGHDAHVAILMAAAEILAKNKNEIKGTIKFIFQPAEEGAPKGEKGGAEVMVKEGVLKNPDADVIFGLHVRSFQPLGTVSYKPGGMMAASDWFTIKVKGRQAHGAAPWRGIDPIVASAQIINALQTIISRQTELTKEAAIITVGTIHGGIRQNIIPEEVEMTGTIRTLDSTMQKDIHEKIVRTVTRTAEASGATATVTFTNMTPVVYNDAKITTSAVTSLQKALGENNIVLMNADTGGEDFAYYQKKIPGFFFFVGACPPDVDPAKAPAHHTPDFMMDEKAMLVGLKAMLAITLNYMYTK
jgi:amidohydrolase